MQDYFKIPIKNGYPDIDTAEDTPISLVYDIEMEYSYIMLDYKTKKESWEDITREEFEAKQAESMPPEEMEAG